ncbi:superoxide dismutase family protein [Flavisphingomonas formosensis]|uniref:superoxide dismutase family protein n=1 Tax=Flavisphingomonas formosensis TaxID=861534 RepID=UPI0012F96AF8|nr:superoxide dismutase family protein [Sphingomonas formosensis]
MRTILTVATAIMFTGAAGTAIAAPTQKAGAVLSDASGAQKATATLTQMRKGIRLVVDATGLPAGVHGVHLHTVGQCAAPDFASAGGHWNPTHKMHGKDNPMGEHMGDLPNITIGADGVGHLDTMIPNAMLSGGEMPLLDADGAAVVIHATADDYKTDPSGNSGGRIACGVLAAR